MWVDAAFDCVSRGQTLPGASRWLRLLRSVGPTPRRGPLTHDWLLPSVRSPSQVGVNVFSHDRDTCARVRASLCEAVAWVTQPPAWMSAGLGRAQFHGGVVWRDGQPTVKVYVSGSAVDLDDLAMTLGVVADDDVFAVGVDFDVDGTSSRARCYRRAHALSHAQHWDRFSAWAALEPEGLSHRVVATLEPPHAGVPKRSFDHIFGPEAELPALLSLGRDVAALAPDCAVSFDEGLLRALEDQLDGVCVRPVSYEVDVFSDGRRQTDALVTVADR